jgi:hypothetical protein
MVYTNAQKNGSLQERVELDAPEMEISISADSFPKDEGTERQVAASRPDNAFNEQIDAGDCLSRKSIVQLH